MATERDCHWRVIPSGKIADVLAGDEVVQQRALHRDALILRKALRKKRSAHAKMCLLKPDFQGRNIYPEYRFFQEPHPALSGKATHQVLRALVDKIPPKVGENN